MSDEFKVEVPTRCNRTGKVSNISMTLDEAAAHSTQMKQRAETAEEIQSFLHGLPLPTPDLVVMFRGKVEVLSYVNESKDHIVQRLLHDLTQSDVFPKPTPKKNGKRKGNPGKSINNVDPGSDNPEVA